MSNSKNDSNKSSGGKYRDNEIESRFNSENFVEANIQYIEAIEKIENKEVRQGLDIMHNIALLFPRFSRVFNYLGWYYEAQFHDYTTAERYYKKGLELKPNFREIYSNYAYCLLIQRKYKELEIFLKECLAVPVTNKEYIYRLMGRIQEKSKKYDLAIESYKQALSETYDMQEIKAYEADIKRCEKKHDLLSKKNRSKKTSRKSN